MEVKITEQTKELIQTKEKLASHDAAAKRAVQTLQTELKKRVDEVETLFLFQFCAYGILTSASPSLSLDAA